MFSRHAEPESGTLSAAGAARSHLKLAVAAFVVAVVSSGICGSIGDIHGTLRQKLLCIGLGALFVVAGVVATRAAATEVYEVVGLRTGPRHAGVLRWLITIVGYVIVMLIALGLFAVPTQRLLVGGALTGVVLGIAAQQALGNVFAGVVLLLARPFSVGDAIRIRSGALGGLIEGTVSAMGMTYVTVITDEGPVSVPNASLLAAGVGPLPGTTYSRSRRFDLSATEAAAALVGRAPERSDGGVSWGRRQTD